MNETTVSTNGPRRIVPEKGIEVPGARREELERGVEALGRQVDALRARPGIADLLPDVEIYSNAVRQALEQDIFHEEADLPVADALLAQGAERAAQLAAGRSPWTNATGLVVRGYRSKLDGSAQPYGLVVPESWDAAGDRRHRLDVWHHGRNNRLTELRFIHDRQTNPGQFTPADTFVLHTYGRFCNAMKFAGEVDTFEALAHAKANYRIDEDRVCVRGFSMGGAATWHMAVHYAGEWAAATPGAGFAETAVYQNAFAKEPGPTAWEQTLWRWYDATDYAENLHQVPLIAYSGENDKQKQAADMMAGYMKQAGLEMVHIIGPGVEHKYHPDSKVEIEKRLIPIVARGRERLPKTIRFTTFTLRYNQMKWVRIDGLEKHWERARVEAEIALPGRVVVRTENVSALTLEMRKGLCPLTGTPALVVDGKELTGAAVGADRSWTTHLTRGGEGWAVATGTHAVGLRKRHGLQGPIDDAFLDSFLIVTPTGKPMAGPAIHRWIAAGAADAAYQWKMQFRGEPRVKADAEVTAEDVRDHHLILWGDPASNSVLKRAAGDLPIVWGSREITVDRKRFTSDRHVPVLIYPNPLNRERYLVLNSGFTFAAYGSQSNANQTPKLPDWAILDTTVTPEKPLPAGVAACGFFGEQWELV